MNEKDIMMLAGEASGDLLAAELLQEMRALFPVRCFGAGGPNLRAAGAELAVDLTAHAVVGVWEVLKHYPALRRLFNQLRKLAISRQPEAIILVDYPGFNLRFAAAIKKYVRRRQGPFNNWRPKVIYYVSPQLWAWHAARVRQIARDVDLMLCIFPFEKAWYAARAPELRVEYVGHPLMDRYQASGMRGAECGAGLAAKERKERGEGLEFKTGNEQPLAGIPSSGRAGLEPPTPRIVLLPGSRAREIKKHLPPMAAAARQIEQVTPVCWQMVLPNEALAELARSLLPEANRFPVQIQSLASALSQATLAVASSGTVTMECALFGVPTVVLYRTSWSTYQLGKRFIKVKYLAMPNVLADELIYPELIQDAATPENISRVVLDLLQNPTRRTAIKEKLARVIAMLGPPGAAGRAASAIARLLGATV